MRSDSAVIGASGWHRVRSLLLVAAAAGLVAIVLPMLDLAERSADAVGDGLQLAAAVVASWFCLRGSRHRRGRERTGWLLLGLGAAGWAAGQLAWTWIEVVQLADPFPSIADVGYLTLYPLAAAGFLLLSPLADRHGLGRGALAIDGALTALAVFVLAWPVLLDPIFDRIPNNALAALTIAYPLGDLVILGMGAGLLMRWREAWRSGLGLAYAAFVCLLVADVGLASGVFDGGYFTGQVADAGWIVGFLLLAAGALAPSPTPAPAQTQSLVLGQTIPIMAVLLGLAGFIVGALRREEIDVGWRLGMALLVILAVTRQFLFTKEFTELAQERAAAQALNTTIVDNAAEGILRSSLDGRILMANQEFARMVGYASVDELTSQVASMPQLYVDAADRQALLDVVAHDGSATGHEVRLRRRDGVVRWVSVNVSSQRAPSGAVELHEFVRDITDTHLLAHDLQRTRRTLLVISRFNEALVRASDEPALLQSVCDSLTTEGGYRMAWVGLAQDDAERSVKPVAQSGFETGYVGKVRATWAADDPRGQGPTGRAIREGKTQIAQDILHDPTMAPWKSDATARGYASSCSLVLDLKQDGRGALMVYAAEPTAFGPDEVRMLEELAGDLAFGVVSLRERAARRHAERQHREVEALFNATVKASLEAIITMDSNGLVRGFNPAAERMFGYSQDEAEGRPLAELLIPPEVRQQHTKGLARTLQTGEGRLLNHRVEVEALRRDGTRFPVELTIIPIEVEGAKMFAGFLRDVTVEHGAREATNRLAAIVDSSHEAIFSISLTGQVLSWNRGAQDIFGFTAAEAIGKSVDQLMVPADRLADCQEMLGVLERGETMERRDAERVRKDGARITVSVALSPIHDARGVIVAGAVTAHDVTQQKAAAAALEQSETRLREAQRVAHVGSWELDIVRNVLHWSDENYRVFGVEPGAFGATYEFFLQTIHPDDREAVRKAYDASVANRTPYAIEHRLVMKDGSVKWVYERCETFYGPDGKPIKSVGTTQDITERKAAEEARRIVEAKDVEVKRLEELNRMRMDFLNTAAHDLKTPLTPLRLQMATLRMRGNLDPKQKESLDLMDRSVNRFQALIEDMLDAARLQAGKLKLKRTSAPLAPLVEEAVASFQEAMRENALQVDVRVDPVVVDADPNKLMQVLMNLVSNAVKYTPKGGSIQVRGTEEAGSARLSVRDSGLGMDAEQIGRLFQPFVRLHEGIPGTAKGTGLGLYISKGIAESHGGRIWAESAGPGRGSTFFVAWPLAGFGPKAQQMAAA